MKKSFLTFILGVIALCAFVAETGAAEKPNVVLMLADNVGYGDIGAYGGGEIRGMPTPKIDRLATEGMQFTQFLVEPGCTPSRAALMTGRYAVRSGLGTIILGGLRNTLQKEEFTLGELFKSKGYATGIVGKWHLGSEEQSWPTRQGFDEYRVGVIETSESTLYRANSSAPASPKRKSKRPCLGFTSPTPMAVSSLCVNTPLNTAARSRAISPTLRWTT